MSKVEYLFGASVTLADPFARKQGCRSEGRAAWLKRDGTTVIFNPTSRTTDR